MSNINTILENILDEKVLGTLSSKTGIDASSVKSILLDYAPKFLNASSSNNEGSLSNLNMLGDLFSSSGQSNMAQELSTKSGVDSSSISSLLAMAIPLIMGALNKPAGSNFGDASSDNSITSMLTNMLDQNKDGSVVDDLADMAKKFFK